MMLPKEALLIRILIGILINSMTSYLIRILMQVIDAFEAPISSRPKPNWKSL